jgi:muconolactone delta-isomerase
MKFLIITKVKDTAASLPPAMARQLLEATMAYMNQHKKEGKILEFYHIPGWGRFVVIGENKSAEEIAQNIIGMPTAVITDFEVYPLADFNESIKMYIETFKMAETLFPGK